MSDAIPPSFTVAKAGMFYFSGRIPSEPICHYS